MKNPKRWPSILIFVIMQVAWLTIVILWLVWYIKSHYALIRRIGAWDIFIIIEGAVLLLLILGCSYILFILYQRQLTLLKTQVHIISSITHEFKTPLATMQLFLETMKKRELPEDTTNQLISGMLLENQRLKSMVEKFLESARLSYKRRPYTLRPISARVFIDGFLHRHTTLLKDVEVHHDIVQDLYLLLDTDAFDMVFSNLAENAIHYSLNTPQIDIRAWQDKKKVYIEFTDHGIGIPKEGQKEIFKMFQRLPEGIAKWSSGTGMGLYVTREIIKAHGGSIRVNRKTSAEGASFLITLPAAKEAYEH
jgi:signal transduction histidine kinase